ncbi:hypothetical protein, conserved [Eimeria tenella]|uniref:Uncharacterized protein n=1 Tax=Eimeria tenella TaxID=5802 RepID=H9B971_EIMTE|nr:hypothetical protein, conserved [Eimeria tenella]AET50531.1 hypothetical protein [Eimeria tenella]CDJ39886.1 hypothetical protein, conserved [Eimeria tenella]|eukprot:XP_013230639.1 hypothetical protein, conserved [Eimeria tenella]
MEAVNKLCSCRFEPLVEVPVPEKAVVWTSKNYYDGSGWVGLADGEKLSLKPTLFADNRLLFLEPVEGVCEAFSSVQSGKYDVKCWSKLGCHLGIEGDQNVFLSTPKLKEVAVYSHPERLPAFPKSWKPLLFTLNSSVITFRLTDTLCLVVTIDESKTTKVHCVDYNGGFALSHPASDSALAYGSLAVKGFEALPHCEVIPRVTSAAGEWGFFVQLFQWGSFVVPKAVDLTRPSSILGMGLGKKVDCLGVLLLPPNLVVMVHLETPKVQRSLQHGKDYLLTAVKTSETDLDIFLVMDGQLSVFNYSFDLRLNRPNKPRHLDNAAFKGSLELDDKKKCSRFIFQNTKNSKVLVPQGCPLSEGDHLVSSSLIAVFDAEICMYLTHPPALKLCSAFNTVALPVD